MSKLLGRLKVKLFLFDSLRPMHAKKVLDYLRALRLERWPRSFAIYVGTFSFFLLNPKSLAFHYPCSSPFSSLSFLTWAVSTANYIINEIADAPFDQHHPVKKTRPLAAGLVSRNVLGALFVLFAVGALGMGYAFFSTPFVLSGGPLDRKGFFTTFLLPA